MKHRKIMEQNESKGSESVNRLKKLITILHSFILLGRFELFTYSFIDVIMCNMSICRSYL